MTPQQEALVRDATRRYWRKNVTVMVVLLAIWAVVGLGCGVLFADTLNEAGKLGGVPLGFWFAQQGSIATFVVLIFVYAVTMNRLDASHHRELEKHGLLPHQRNGQDAAKTGGGDA